MKVTATADKVAKCAIQTTLEAELAAYNAFTFQPLQQVTVTPTLTGWAALSSWNPPTDFS